MVRQAQVICVTAPPIHLGAWSMAMAAFFNLADDVTTLKFAKVPSYVYR